ncbi:hypothetical protein CHARACLAT_030451 [Characodon lateralis]|uniref:Uncharacterized protein n=1 Tax=Characodon lateralis TaxID=208331 RepID=A0ABU7CSK2_9TELE|nr:hypothetical protein [Characodon lateralis]
MEILGGSFINAYPTQPITLQGPRCLVPAVSTRLLLMCVLSPKHAESREGVTILTLFLLHCTPGEELPVEVHIN